jgi:hypothetical protein
LADLEVPGAEEGGVGNPSPTPLSLTQLKPWVLGRGGQAKEKKKKRKKKKKRHPKKGFFVCFEGKSQKGSLFNILGLLFL